MTKDVGQKIPMTLRLPPKLRSKLKGASQTTGISETAIIEAALNEYFKQPLWQRIKDREAPMDLSKRLSPTDEAA